MYEEIAKAIIDEFGFNDADDSEKQKIISRVIDIIQEHEPKEAERGMMGIGLGQQKFGAWIFEIDSRDVWEQLHVAVHNRLLIRAEICIAELRRREDEDAKRTIEKMKEIKGETKVE